MPAGSDAKGESVEGCSKPQLVLLRDITGTPMLHAGPIAQLHQSWHELWLLAINGWEAHRLPTTLTAGCCHGSSERQLTLPGELRRGVPPGQAHHAHGRQWGG